MSDPYPSVYYTKDRRFNEGYRVNSVLMCVLFIDSIFGKPIFKVYKYEYYILFYIT